MIKNDSHTKVVSRNRRDLRFKPYMLTPSQYFESCGPNLYFQPEKMLMLAVLEDAIDHYRQFLSARDAHGKSACREAADWFWSDQMDWPFSYKNICDALGFDPDYLRQGLFRTTENKVARATDGVQRKLPLGQKYHRGLLRRSL